MKATGKELQIHLNTPFDCKGCHTPLNQRKDGYYICPKCGSVYMDNLARAKAFLYRNPNATFEELVEGTELPEETIKFFIEHGYIVIPSSNKNFKNCKKCGRFIIKGRYCSLCALGTFKQIKEDFDS